MLPPNFSAGPHGLGDPNDKTLRKVEKDVLIPMKMREKSKNERCVAEVEAFEECCKSSGFLMVYKCRDVTSALNKCFERWYNDKQFQEECTNEYLEERSEYRKTGIRKKQQQKHSTTF